MQLSKVNLKLGSIFLLIAFFLLLRSSYNTIIVKEFSYLGFESYFNINNLYIALVSFSIIVITLLIVEKEDAFYVIYLIVLFQILPVYILSIYGGTQWFFMLYYTVTVFFIGFFSKFGISVMPRINFRKKKVGLRELVIIGILLTVPFFLTYGFRKIDVRNLLLINIYDTRLEFRDLGNVYTGYLYSPLVKFYFPILILLCINFKKKGYLFLSIFLVIYLFLCGAHKAVLFSIFVTIVLGIIKIDNYKLVSLMAVGLCSMMVFSQVLYAVYDVSLVDNLITRRVFFVPAMLNKEYYSFFEFNPLLWSESLNGIFREYPFSTSASFIIGEKVFGTFDARANNGLASDAFMNFGWYSILIYPFLVSVFFSFLFSQKLPNYITRGIFFFLVLSTTSSQLFTLLLTHGIWFLVLLIVIYLRNVDYSVFHSERIVD